jgi:hypothetical protein
MLDLENMDDARERILNELQRNNVYLNPSPPSLEDKCLATVLEVAATTGGRAGVRLGPSEIHQIGNAACSKVCID